MKTSCRVDIFKELRVCIQNPACSWVIGAVPFTWYPEICPCCGMKTDLLIVRRLWKKEKTFLNEKQTLLGYEIRNDDGTKAGFVWVKPEPDWMLINVRWANGI
jgi:hypothetical protein